MTPSKKNWWDTFFDHWHAYFEKFPKSKTNQEVRWYIKKLDLKKGSTLLDCPCGPGRVSIPMARQGIRVTGVDITKSYLEKLETQIKKHNLPITCIHSDMRRINFKNRFDAAANLWTSFGYFKKESDNLLVLKKIYQSLKPGGKFVLQLINRDWLLKNFEIRGWDEVADMKLLEEREFDYATSVIHGRWTFIKNGREHIEESYIRTYAYHELKTMFEKVGFVAVEGFSSVKEEPLSNNKNWMYIYGRKPAKG